MYIVFCTTLKVTNRIPDADTDILLVSMDRATAADYFKDYVNEFKKDIEVVVREDYPNYFECDNSVDKHNYAVFKVELIEI